MTDREDKRVQEEDFNRVEGFQRSLKKMVKPIRCPICQCECQVMGVPNKDTGEWVYTSKIVRQSSLEECPRCNCGKKQVAEYERQAAIDKDRKS